MEAQISKHFTWREALWLPSWGREATEQDGLTDAVCVDLADLFAVMEVVRRLCGDRPINVHCAYRPAAYNKEVGGATRSAHITGQAVDFDVAGMSCDEVRALLLPSLPKLGMRMECKPGSNWVHVDRADDRPGARYFIP